ncbi:hypothetical protein ZIOFF_046813 [Zingiber officinale]|uniref:Uncharacterized protein n=1 Tax=Zingiber officinale TaxID=94328 RepID=A0A8J5FQK0_ZINOF|nr:hypothetical protein ZIOFF_046813 [Zingiber officinale]
MAWVRSRSNDDKFISDFGKPTAPLPAAIVVCVPAKAHTDGVGESEFKIHPHEITVAIIVGEKAKTNETILLEEEVIEKNVESGLQSHPLFFSITLGLLAELINSSCFDSALIYLSITDIGDEESDAGHHGMVATGRARNLDNLPLAVRLNIAPDSADALAYLRT